jgi:hypothetical protein
MDQTFQGAHAAIRAYLRGSNVKGPGADRIATLHLIARSLGDLHWSQSAATAGFPIQAYSLMRPAWEAINLCDLFAQWPEKADEWAGGQFQEFSPTKVRKQLGKDTDPFYSFMSERSHPRFAGLQMTIFKTGGAPGEAVAHLRVPLEITPAYMAVATPAIILARLTTQVGRLNFEDREHRPRNLAPLIRSVASAIKLGWATMDAGLEDWERNDPEVQRPNGWAEDIGGLLDQLADDVDRIYGASPPPPVAD